ncbi:hypothetical protein SAMN04487898_12249 [Pedobacter sp. ok626]|uniref:hypothetical protein n=1 Tax=Pedobacter sp. ok626 TaxID=1761882 RepID=UPI000888C9BE|nr:hypothetical protein [Pedobacter sp. ok626]SDL65912.1 hypothetical protein SAMN04487898_12249 [Pedobacter sp. ok626]
MKRLIYICLTLIVLFIGCAKDKPLTISGLDVNYYKKEDSADPIDHLIYQVYQSTGIPIFYNDTIGVQNRGVDLAGKPLMYYERLDLNYFIEGTNGFPTTFTIPKKRAKITDGVVFLRDSIIPELKKYNLKPRSFLLTDTLRAYSSGYKYVNTIKGLTTTVLSNLNVLNTKTNAAKSAIKTEIMANEISAYISDYKPGTLVDFYKVSDALFASYNLSSLNGISISYFNSYPRNQMNVRFYTFLSIASGFISSPTSFSYTTPSRQQDVSDYIKAVLANQDATFLAANSAYPNVIKKYNIMKTIVESIKQK